MQYNKNVLIRKGGSIITKKTFGEYVSVKNGYAFKRKNFVEKGIPIIRISDLTTNNMNLKECAKYPYHTKVDFKKYLVSEGDILIAMSGSIGKIGIVKGLNGECFLNQRVGNLKIKDETKLNKTYLYYLINSNFFQKEIRRLSSGGMQANISAKKIESIEINIPTLNIQKAHANHLMKIDAIIKNRNLSIELLDDYTKNIFYNIFGDITNNKLGWDIKKIKDIGTVKTGNTPPRKNLENYGNYIEWIKSDNINTPNMYLTKSKESLSKIGYELGRIAPENSVLVSCIAGSISSLGNVAIANRNVCFNQQINSITPNEQINEIFLYYLINNSKEYFQSFAKQSLKYIINKKTFEEIRIICPPIELQNKFAELIKKTEIIKKNQMESKRELEKLFNIASEKVFNGEKIC